MTDAPDDAGVEHSIIVESKQLFRGTVPPEMAEALTGEYEASNIMGRTWKAGPSLEFDKEISVTYECKCGRCFRKSETAREHLEEVADER